MWVTYNIEDFIIRTVTIGKAAEDEDAISKAITKYIHRVFDGNVNNFAEKLGVYNNDLWAWSEFIKRPTLGEILHICWTANVLLYDFLKPTYLDTQFVRSSARSQATSLSALQQRLEKIMGRDDFVPRTLGDVATETGCSKEFLLRHFPELCKKILIYQKKIRKDKQIKWFRYIQYLVRKEAIELMAASYLPIWRLVYGRLRWHLKPDIPILRNQKVITIWRNTINMLGCDYEPEYE